MASTSVRLTSSRPPTSSQVVRRPRRTPRARRTARSHQRVAEVVHRHGQRQQFARGDAAAGERGGGEGAAQRRHRRLAAERRQIGADEARRDARQLVHVHVVRERHVAAVDAQDLAAALRVGRVQADLAVEAARTAQRGIERVGAVRRADDDHLAARAQAVHQREELADDALLDLAPDLRALGARWRRSRRGR